MNEAEPRTVRQPGPLSAIIATITSLQRRHGPDVVRNAAILVGDGEWDALRASPGMRPWIVAALGNVQTAEAEIYRVPLEVMHGQIGTSIVLRGEPGWEKFVAAQGVRMARLWLALMPPAQMPALGATALAMMSPTLPPRIYAEAIATIAARIA